jgi:hypothetical protein
MPGLTFGQLKESLMRSLTGVLAATVALSFVALAAPDADAFCGFYVAKADAKLFNQASQVVIVRDQDRTVLTMANDYQGKVKDFAMVIPVPTKLERGQIHIGDMKVVDHVDAYTTPRLVEYYDPDPCPQPNRMRAEEMAYPSAAPSMDDAMPMKKSAKSLGVTIEAKYTVGEYDILILSAQQSDGLVEWLKQEKYRIPDGAEPVIDSYLKQKMKWFVAKVNLAEHDKLGGGKLRPIQVAYESPKFMLPIRLGTVNANGPQDLIVYLFTKDGRVEATNYRTVKLPTDKNVPEYTQGVFGDFYKAMFAKVVEQHQMKAVVTEYAWNLSINCDPCSADPIIPQLKSLGVWWVDNIDDYHSYEGGVGFVTRLHVRYDRERFPEDLVFQTTKDKTNFQGRYVINHPFKGSMECDAAGPYQQSVWKRQQEEAKNLAELTGWKLADIKTKMSLSDTPPKVTGKAWYDKLWK